MPPVFAHRMAHNTAENGIMQMQPRVYHNTFRQFPAVESRRLIENCIKLVLFCVRCVFRLPFSRARRRVAKNETTAEKKLCSPRLLWNKWTQTHAQRNEKCVNSIACVSSTLSLYQHINICTYIHMYVHYVYSYIHPYAWGFGVDGFAESIFFCVRREAALCCAQPYKEERYASTHFICIHAVCVRFACGCDATCAWVNTQEETQRRTRHDGTLGVAVCGSCLCIQSEATRWNWLISMWGVLLFFSYAVWLFAARKRTHYACGPKNMHFEESVGRGAWGALQRERERIRCALACFGMSFCAHFSATLECANYVFCTQP